MEPVDISSFASYFAGMSLEDVPEPVRAAASESLTNAMGVAIGGLEEEAPRRALRATARLDSGDQALVIGTGDRRSADHAAFVQAVAAHVLDFDDTDLATIYHPSCVLHGALWSLAQTVEVSGEDLLRSWAIGLEVGLRLASALGMPHYDRGWHVTGTAGAVAASAASAALLGATEEDFGSAINLAATTSAGHRVHFGYDAKSGHAGFAAQHGVTCALLALEGFSAAPEGITGSRGLLGVIGAGGSPEALVAGVGDSWRILDNRIKPYASGVVTHPAIDLARTIRDRSAQNPDAVQSIELHVHPLVGELTNNPTPITGLQGKFSVAHCFAAGLLLDSAGSEAFLDSTVTDVRFTEFRGRVRVVVDPGVEHMTAWALVERSDGTQYRVETEEVRGSQSRPLNSSELCEKFVGVTASRVTGEVARDWYERLGAIVEIPDVTSFVQELDRTLGHQVKPAFPSDTASTALEV